MPDSFIKKLARYLGEGKKYDVKITTAMKNEWVRSEQERQRNFANFLRDFRLGYQQGSVPTYQSPQAGLGWTPQGWQAYYPTYGGFAYSPQSNEVPLNASSLNASSPASNYQWGPYRNPSPYAEWTPNGYITSPSPATPASPAPASPAPAPSSGYRSDFSEVMAKMSAANASPGWYGDNGYQYNSQAEALADGNKNVLYFSPSYGTGGGSPRGSRGYGGKTISGGGSRPNSILGWGGEGFRDLRNKRRSVWEQRAQENAPATGTGVSSGRVGGMASWRV